MNIHIKKEAIRKGSLYLYSLEDVQKVLRALHLSTFWTSSSTKMRKTIPITYPLTHYST